MSPIGAFTRGAEAGRRAGEGGNIFSQMLEAVSRVERRRRTEDSLRAKEDRELINTIKLLKKRFALEKEAQAPKEAREERRLGLEEQRLKQQTINNAYKVAQDTASMYLENPDPEDKNPAITARALAAETFDDYMAKTNYADVTFLSATQPEREEGMKAEEERPRRFIFPPPTLPETAPPEAKVGERIGGIARKGVEAISRLPSQAVGLGGTTYNVLAGGVSGLTGIPQRVIPQESLDVMRRGQLFDIPAAVRFYSDLFKRIRRQKEKPLGELERTTR